MSKSKVKNVLIDCFEQNVNDSNLNLQLDKHPEGCVMTYVNSNTENVFNWFKKGWTTHHEEIKKLLFTNPSKYMQDSNI